MRALGAIDTGNSKPNGCGAANASASPSTGTPVIIATGEKWLPQTDFQSYGLYGLSLSRTYRSVYRPGYSGMFGPSWQSNYDFGKLDITSGGCTYDIALAACMPNYVIVGTADGAQYTYHRTPGSYNYYANGVVSATNYLYWSASFGRAGAASSANSKRPAVGQRPIPDPPTGDAYPEWIHVDKRTTTFYSPAGLVTSIVYTDPQGPTRWISIGRLATAGNRVQSVSTGYQTIQFTWTGNRVTAVKEPGGQTWNYGYDGAGNLISVTPPGAPAPATVYGYDTNFSAPALTSVTVDGVLKGQFQYYTTGPNYGKAKEVNWGNGEVRDQFEYTGNSITSTTKVTNAAGSATTYTFNQTSSFGKQLMSTSRANGASCAAASAASTYDPATGYRTSSTDWNGNVTHYDYDSSGRLKETTSAFGTAVASTVVNSWDGDDLTQAEYRDASGTPYLRYGRTYYTAANGDKAYRLKSETWTDLRTSKVRTITYDYTFGTSTTTITATRNLPSGPATTTTVYDSAGNLTSVTNPLGHAVQYQGYNGRGQPTTVLDPNNVATTFGYDLKGNTETITVAGLQPATYVYDNSRRVTRINEPSLRVRKYQYNGADRVTDIGNGFNEWVNIARNVSTTTASNTATTTADRKLPLNSSGTPTGFASGQFSQTHCLDCLGRTVIAKGTNGQTVTYVYDGNGNLSTATDAANRQTQWFYDEQDRLKKTIAPDDGETNYTYDATGAVHTVTDHRNHITTYTLDGFGQTTNLSSPDTGNTSYTLDNWGRVTHETRADGTAVSYIWDALDRLKSRTATRAATPGMPAAPAVTETYGHDAGTYGKGRLTSLSDASGSTSYTYNAAGQLLTQVNTIGTTAAPYNAYTSAAPLALTTSWTYDAVGRLSTLSYPNATASQPGPVLTYTYGSYGRLASITSTLYSGATDTLISNILYQPATDRPYAWKRGDGTLRLVSLDTDGRVTNLDSSGVNNLSYAYTANLDSIRQINDANNTGLNTGLLYDDNDRLKTVTRAGQSQQITWDRVDNRESIAISPNNSIYTPDSNSNRLNAVGGAQWRNFTHNAVGNITGETRWDGSRGYGYDALGRMNTVTLNGTLTNSYWTNALNQRVLKNRDSGFGRFVYGPGGEMLNEHILGSDGATNLSYLWFNGELLGQVRHFSGTTGIHLYYAHNDHLGRTEKLTNRSGVVKWSVANAPWGREQAADAGESTAGLNFGLPGQYLDAATGLWYNGHRYYDQDMGRYLQSDPIGLAGGINTYTYVQGNPISAIDPDGQFGQLIVGGLIGGIGSAIGAAQSCGATAGDIALAGAVGAAAGAVTAAVPIAGPLVNAIARNALAGGLGNAIGQLLTGGPSSFSLAQSITQAAVGGVAGGLGNVVGLSAVFSLVGQRSGWTTAEAVARGSGVGTTSAIAGGALANTGVSSSLGGMRSSGCSCPK